MSVAIESLTIGAKVASLVITCLKESSLKGVAKMEAEMAILICKDLVYEENPREGLNRALTHLESAIGAYSKTIGTWDIWDKDRALWPQYEIYNKVCVLIAIVHYALGNIDLVKVWLIDRMSYRGPWKIETNTEDFHELGISNKNSFDETLYKHLLGNEYSKFQEKVIKPSATFYEITFSSDNDNNWMYNHGY